MIHRGESSLDRKLFIENKPQQYLPRNEPE